MSSREGRDCDDSGEKKSSRSSAESGRGGRVVAFPSIVRRSTYAREKKRGRGPLAADNAGREGGGKAVA